MVAGAPAATAVKVTAHRALVGASVVILRRAVAVLAMAVVTIQAVAALKTTAARLRHVPPTVVETMRAARIAHRVPVVAGAGAIAMG